MNSSASVKVIAHYVLVTMILVIGIQGMAMFNGFSSASNATNFMGNSSIQNEKQLVQSSLVDLLKRALILGAEIPKVPTFDEPSGGIVYVRVLVNNSEDKIANASEFSIQYTYPFGVGFTNAGNDVGAFIRIPEGTYSIRGMDAMTVDEDRKVFLNSFKTGWDAGCDGTIRSGESKECTVTKFH